jgi:16S rRNA (uracil1498-N3)-methyltransferase
VVRFTDHGGEKIERWRRITRRGSRQSGRSPSRRYRSRHRFGHRRSHRGCQKRVVLYEREKTHHLKGCLRLEGRDATCVAIGPEGGIEEAEIEWLKENGFITCTLGENIFRTETTPLVVLSVILYEYARGGNENRGANTGA